MNEYKDYRFIAMGSESLRSAAVNTTPTSNISTKPAEESAGFSEGLAKAATNKVVQQTVLSPLNSATGGMATPTVQMGKAIYSGNSAAIGMGVVGLAYSAINWGISAYEKRIAKLESKVEELGNRDNTLVRSGAKDFATNSSADIFGIKNTNRRL